MHRTRPEDALTAAMTVQALRILLGYRELAAVRKTHDAERRCRILHMRRAGPVAGFAALHFELVARIKLEHLGMDRVRPVLRFLGVARDTSRLPDIGALIECRRRHWCRGRDPDQSGRCRR